MKAVGYFQSLPIDHENALMDLDVKIPEVQGRDVLVQVKAISVNPIDTKIRMRKSGQQNAPVILGWDAVGEVVETGDSVSKFNVGDKVWYAGSVDRQGTNAQYHLVDERIVGKKPENIPDHQAAALPLTALTAYEMLFDRLRVESAVPGAANAVVIIGGAGGVGSVAIQLMRALTNKTIIASASREETKTWVKELGAHHVIDHTLPLPKQINELGIEWPGIVFSTTHSHQYSEQIAEFISPQGRFGLIDDPQNLNIMPFKTKAVSIHWEMMFTRALFETVDMEKQGTILNIVAKLLDEGKIKSTVTEVLGKINAENLKRAHSLLESHKARGKIVLQGF